MNAISGRGEKKEHSSSEQKVEWHRDSCWKCRSQFHEMISEWVKTKFYTELHSVWNIKWYSCLLCSHFSRDIHSYLSITQGTVYSSKTGKKLGIISKCIQSLSFSGHRIKLALSITDRVQNVLFQEIKVIQSICYYSKILLNRRINYNSDLRK